MHCCDWPDSAVWPSYEIWKFPFQLMKFEVSFPFHSLASEEKKTSFFILYSKYRSLCWIGSGGYSGVKVMGQKQKKTQKPPGLSAKDKTSLVKTFIAIKMFNVWLS